MTGVVGALEADWMVDKRWSLLYCGDWSRRYNGCPHADHLVCVLVEHSLLFPSGLWKLLMYSHPRHAPTRGMFSSLLLLLDNYSRTDSHALSQ